LADEPKFRYDLDPMRHLLLPLLLLFVVSACGDDDTTLRVTGLSRDTGSVNGDTYLIIKGNGFTHGGARTVKVYFGNQQGSVIRFASDSEIVVQPPGGKPGPKVDVLVVFDPGGQIKIPNAYSWVEKDDTPTSVDDLNTNGTTKKKP